jgi:hypothetical protein
MNFRKHVQTFAMASMLAMTVVGVPAMQVHAEKAGTPQPNLCSTDDGNGNFEFYLPGDLVSSVSKTSGQVSLSVCDEAGQLQPVRTSDSRPAPQGVRGTGPAQTLNQP